MKICITHIITVIGLFQLFLLNGQQSPVGVDTIIYINEDEALSANMPVFDPDNNLKTLSIIKGAYHGDFNLNTDGSFYYFPNAEYSGTDSVVWKATDSTDMSVSRKITIIIAPVNDLPVAESMTFSVDEDISFNDILLATDNDDIGLIYSVNQPAIHGDVIVSQNGSFEYTPDPNFFGADTFYWQVTDQKSEQVTAQAIIQVNEVNDGPVAENLSFSGCSVIVGQLVATDADADILEFTLKSNPEGGSIVIDKQSGEFNFTAQPRWSEQTSFEFYVTDAQGLSGIGSVSLNIYPEYSSTEIVSICSGESYILADGREITKTGEYASIFKSVHGCDSVLYISLTVNPSYTVNISATICNGSKYVLPDNTVVSKPDQYACILQSSTGCDSIVYISLSQAQTYSATVIKKIKEGQSYVLPDGKIVETTGSYTSTLKTQSGCDSIIITQLTVAPTLYSQKFATICSGESYQLPSGNQVSSEGTYIDSLVSKAGGDSIITTTLTIAPNYSIHKDVKIKEGILYTLPDGLLVGQAGNYVSYVKSSLNCDSTITTNLTIIPKSVNIVEAAICEGESYALPLGRIVSETGFYYDILTSIAGGDSIIETNLMVHPVSNHTQQVSINNLQSYTLPDGRVVKLAGTYISKLQSSQGCDSIIVTKLVVLSAIENTQTRSGLKTYPNPVSDYLYIELEDACSQIECIVSDMDGKIIVVQKLVVSPNETLRINLAKLSKGIYIIDIKTDNRKYTRKFIKY